LQNDDCRQQLQNVNCKTTIAKRQLQNVNCKTTIAKRQLQNDNCKTASAKRQLQNDNRKTTIAKRQLQRDNCKATIAKLQALKKMLKHFAEPPSRNKEGGGLETRKSKRSEKVSFRLPGYAWYLQLSDSFVVC